MIEALAQLKDNGTPLTAGWQAQLQLRFGASDGRTRLTHREHQGPLLVQRVFYPEGAGGRAGTAEPCHVYLVHPPGGLVSGDRLRLEAEVEPGAHLLLTTPAAGKFYRRREASVARAEQRLRVDGGVLEWLPQENIYYPETSAAVSTVVHLAGQARFIGWEIGCVGWPTVGASLGGGTVRQTLELWLDERPLLLERLCIEGEGLAARWGLGGYTAYGSWLAYPALGADGESARAAAAKLHCAEMMLACTIVDGVLCCRALARRTDYLKHAFLDLWRLLRPSLLGREAVAPRIWAT